ncbi:MAG: hypothetical protein LBD94_02330, partial [Rickettsiales bacterium]|nr:hypothetical protein [Rickettsiales bacterium]
QQAQQSQQQIEQMNAQMQQIQQQMAAQQAQSAQQMQEALAAQQAQNQALLEQQQAAAVAQQQVSSVISAPADMEAAIDRGVDANVIARQQIIGQVMNSLDGVDDGLNSLKKIVEDLRTYANCDYSIAKCEGPKRVAAFRHKAKQFFEPYDNVAVALEDSIFTAQAAGVDVTEIYMLLSGSCMQWAKYICQVGEPLYYCEKGKTFSMKDEKGKCGEIDAPTYKTSVYTEQHSNPHCTPTGLYKQSESETVQQDWLISIEEGNKTKIKLACISEGAAQMMASNLGRRSKSKTSGSLDVDAMQTMINFDLDEKVADDRGRNQYQCLPKSHSPEIGSYITYLKSILNNKNFDYKNTKTGITDEDGNLNVGWSICDTHAHNIGEDNNPEDSEKKEQMDEVIALKSTIMVRLFKKQYDFLAAMIKQVKTQMQKSVMTATAEAAGATKESSSGNNAVSGQIDCRNKNRADTISCVRNNMTALQQMVDSRKTSDFRNAIKWNVEALKGVGAESDKDIVIKFNDKCPNNMSGANMTDCITEMRSALQMLEDKEREANRSTYNGR